MASIIDYFNSLPTSVGSSTFQLDNLTSNKLLDPTMSNYQTLIGSVDSNFKNSFEGTNNKYPALLMHAADIFWGDAVFTDEAALERLSEINLYKTKRIRTSRDIIAILEYLLAHVGNAPEIIDLSVTPESLSLSESKTSGTFTAAISKGTIDGSKVSWKLTKKTGADNIQLNASTGTTVTVSRKSAPTAPAANRGTIKVGNWTTNENLGTATVTATFTKGADAKNDLGCTYEVTASYPGTTSDVTKTVTYTGSASTPGLTEGAWFWETTGEGMPQNSLPAGIQISGQNTKTVTLTNTTSSSINVYLGCTNTNGVTVVTNIYVPAKKVVKNYYYLASVWGLDGNKNYVGADDVFGEFDIIGNGEKVIKLDFLQTSLPNVKEIQANSSNNANIWAANSTFNEHGAKKFYPFIIAPKTWYNNNSSKVIKPVAGGDAVKDTYEFTYDGDAYILVISRMSASNNNPSNPVIKIISD